ncbi:chemotaxis protein CheW [Sporomusa sp. KB1]|jgi:purine-binding chemotaxis protein CheW|uniref:chemotaxis protein CheW n=1 Tax=Sporomusa sp. KB1 TaxID=943346 RepID=UPI0011A52356|nr:chemotaxis protein CheW [Sporomusa sp. KB1]TWH45401.1 CheW protein [Sporomusa sp. KB1]
MSRVQLVVFDMDGQEFGIDARLISGILRAKRCNIQKDSSMPKEIEGRITLRGNVSYVYNLRYKLSLENTPIKEESKIIIACTNDMPIGLGCIVDEIKDIVYFDDEEIERPICFETGEETPYIDGIGRVGERRIIILDFDRLLVEAGRETNIQQLA